MGRFKIQKKDVFIDMTPMSDVMVLLLTFFMLTATFVKKEPVKVNAPGSVSDIKIPDANILTILIEPSGRVFMQMDKKGDLMSVMDMMSEKYNIPFTVKEKSDFSKVSAFGVPMEKLKSFLALPTDKREGYLSSAANEGIPCDSTNNQFKDWVSCATEVNPDLGVAIKADATTPYRVIKKVMNSLQDIKVNRYNLITNLKKVKSVDE